jgi:hypothetical protein
MCDYIYKNGEKCDLKINKETTKCFWHLHESHKKITEEPDFKDDLYAYFDGYAQYLIDNHIGSIRGDDIEYITCLLGRFVVDSGGDREYISNTNIEKNIEDFTRLFGLRDTFVIRHCYSKLSSIKCPAS